MVVEAFWWEDTRPSKLIKGQVAGFRHLLIRQESGRTHQEVRHLSCGMLLYGQRTSLPGDDYETTRR